MAVADLDERLRFVAERFFGKVTCELLATDFLLFVFLFINPGVWGDVEVIAANVVRQWKSGCASLHLVDDKV